MARQLRIEYAGAFYHVSSRGNLKEMIFFEDRDREKFLEILKRTKETFCYLLHAYVLMKNHYHLLLETPQANLSRIMQNINTSYTVYVNNKYNRSGHLLQGRYKSILVEKESYLLELGRYIHLNPVRKGLVSYPAEYKWSSYAEYITTSKIPWLVDIEDTLSYLSVKRGKAIKSYKSFVEDVIAKKLNPFNNLKAGVLLGREKFEQHVRRLLCGKEDDEELPSLRKIQVVITVQEVVDTLTQIYGEDILGKRGSKGEKRKIAIYLSKVMSGDINKEVGKYFGIKSPAVSKTVKAIEESLTGSISLQRDIDKLKKTIKKRKKMRK